MKPLRSCANKAECLYTNFPLSGAEILAWRERYFRTQESIGVPLIDAAGAFEKLSKAERLETFTDLAHLTAKGNRLLAEAVAQTNLLRD